jgi:cyclopropane fatty-acyl-phospholipid synthase-like methyltransferase
MKDYLLEQGWLPDWCIRKYVKLLCQRRIQDERKHEQHRKAFLEQFISEMSNGPIALETDAANMQHYEVSTAFFQNVLGSRMKYSACHWGEKMDLESIDQAEKAMLEMTCQHADIKNGMRILELGCGWGSLSLFIAQLFPDCQILAVSNSSTQKAYIDTIISKKKLDNLTVVTADMNDFMSTQKFDRVISIEMFEHMRNWQKLFLRISDWLKPVGKLFIHIFTFDGRPYFYDANNPDDWMARNFFAGGMMPCPELMQQCQDVFSIQNQWQINGRHYEKTLNAWLAKMDRAKSELFPLFQQEYGRDGLKYWNHWRVFFIACAEVFGYGYGKMWFINHYLLRKSQD